MDGPASLPGGTPPPAGFEPWCTTLRGQQAWVHVAPDGPAALAMWRGLRDRHPRTGLWPVILGSDAQVVDQLTWRLDMLARDVPGIPDVATVRSAEELLVEWMGDPAADEYLEDVPRHLAKLEADAQAIRERMAQRPDEAAVRALAGAPIHLALVPAAGGWEVPALLAWSGAEGSRKGGAEHLAILHFWHQVYGAELVAMGLEQLELLVERPPDTARAAFELAVQHYAYCPALMDNLAPAIGALAATLFGRHWLFDWS